MVFTITTICIFLVAIYLVAGVLYNIFFHPLAGVPGPFWCKVSGWPSCYAAMTGHRHIWVWRHQQIYGDKFRYKPNGVMFASPKAYFDIYNPKANVKKANFYQLYSRNKDDENALNTVDKVKHAIKRKPLNKAFSEKSLQAMAPLVDQHISRWIEFMLDGDETRGTSEWATPKNLGGEWADFLTFDILGDLCFGKDFNTKDPADNPLKDIPRVTRDYLKFTYSVSHSPFVDMWVWLKPRGLDAAVEMVIPTGAKMFFNFVEECVKQRMHLEEETNEHDDKQKARQDLFHFVSSARDSTNAPFSYGELLSSARLLMLAGSDTTSTAFCSIFFYLSRNSQAYYTLAKEIRTTFTSFEDIRLGTKLSNCRYLQACIQEGLRMTPGGPSELQREILPGGYSILDETYPAGTIVGCPGFPVHYHDETYGDPFVFRPERWIPNEEQGITAGDVARLKEAFHPFSMGPGVCPGKNLAMYELQVTFARLIYSCDFRRPPEDLENIGAGNPRYGWMRHDKNLYQVLDGFLAMREGPMIQVRRIS